MNIHAEQLKFDICVRLGDTIGKALASVIGEVSGLKGRREKLMLGIMFQVWSPCREARRPLVEV